MGAQNIRNTNNIHEKPDCITANKLFQTSGVL